MGVGEGNIWHQGGCAATYLVWNYVAVAKLLHHFDSQVFGINGKTLKTQIFETTINQHLPRGAK